MVGMRKLNQSIHLYTYYEVKLRGLDINVDYVKVIIFALVLETLPFIVIKAYRNMHGVGLERYSYLVFQIINCLHTMFHQ